MMYLFGNYSLDPGRRELRRGTELIALEPQVFDLLQYLIRNRQRVVSKDDLIEAVWKRRIVSDSALTSRLTAARHAIGDSGEQQRLIRTLPRKGLRFVGEVREEQRSGYAGERLAQPITGNTIDGAVSLGGDRVARSSSQARDPELAVEPLPSLSLPNQPSIAILPFTNMSGSSDQEYFADGIAEDITTELAKIPELFVIARNSSFRYKGMATDVRQVGHDLGVRYVLEGSVRRAGDRIRISTQLIDAESGGHIWAQKYDRDYSDIFALQDAITDSVVAAIQPEIMVRESRRAACKTSANLEALDCYMRGLWHFHQFGLQEGRQAEYWLRRSIEIEPTLARAHAALSRTLSIRCWAGFSEDIDRDLGASLIAAERALALDDGDASGHFAFSILSLMTRRHETALAAAHRAIDCSSNFALGHFALGETCLFMGRFVETFDPIMRCLRLTPRDPFASLHINLIAMAHYHLGDYSEAVHYSERALQSRRIEIVLRTLAASLGQLGRTDEAGALFAEMERLKPVNADRHWELTNPYAHPVHEAHFLEGLRKAGQQAN